MAPRLRRLVREPLVHFLLLGGLMFLFYEWRTGGAGPGGNRIVVRSGQVAAMASTFQRTWMRPPTPRELNGLVQDYIREEIAVREAIAQGLDEDDTIIRRRLRQKLEFFVEDEATMVEPTEDELEAWLAGHPDDFRRDDMIAFRQVYVSTDRRGEAAAGDARAILGELRSGADPSTAGDPTMLPAEVAPARLTDVARQFGQAFANRIVEVERGKWVGPVQSGLGLHLLYITAFEPGRVPELDDVREVVRREIINARRAEAIDSLYAGLAARYDVTIEVPRDDMP